MLNVYKISKNNSIYGPGKRTVIWFKGCSIRCKGCINPELWNRSDDCNMSIDDLLLLIQNDGVTLLGGEPLDQDDLEHLIDKLIEQKKSIILFTGYSKIDFDERKRRISSKCDVVISGPYIEDLKDDSLYLRGSTNQQVTFYSSRYNEKHFDKCNIMEINIKSNEIISYGRNKNIIKELLNIDL